MSIKCRLIISYVAMLIIPIILSFFAAIAFFHKATNETGSVFQKPNFFREATKRAPEIYLEMETTIKDSPEKLLSRDYAETIDKKLNIFNSGMVITKNSKIVYSTSLFDEPKLLSKISNGISGSDHNIMIEDTPYNIVDHVFSFSDKQTGHLYLITDVGPIGKFAEKFFSSLSISVLIIIVLTNGILTFIVSRSILKPLKLLGKAANHIKDGDLDFKLDYKRCDEIGKVCTAFEEMRARLKDSLNSQMQYEDNRKELIASISHDLKTPITSIKGYVEGILDGVADTPEKHDKYLTTIYSKSSHMDRLIDDLFMFSKLDLKRIPFNFEEINIKEFFNDCIDELSMDMESKGVKLIYNNELTFDSKILADREMLKRVIVNIIENALKYADKDNKLIEINLWESNYEIGACIKDNGSGIPFEDLDQIFQSFYRTDSARSSDKGGSGLGLPIAKQIIEAHKGKIWAESVLNYWTKICFSLNKI